MVMVMAEMEVVSSAIGEGYAGLGCRAYFLSVSPFFIFIFIFSFFLSRRPSSTRCIFGLRDMVCFDENLSFEPSVGDDGG
ncbi:hypothetical protein LY78DRAFT_446991 [Colletotrichum sublineola]|nr:hypothetical protein LY78DRAFT_446991 [Colletotrichum sublineola]